MSLNDQILELVRQRAMKIIPIYQQDLMDRVANDLKSRATADDLTVLVTEVVNDQSSVVITGKGVRVIGVDGLGKQVAAAAAKAIADLSHRS